MARFCRSAQSATTTARAAVASTEPKNLLTSEQLAQVVAVLRESGPGSGTDDRVVAEGDATQSGF